jgi:hypothetical protein
MPFKILFVPSGHGDENRFKGKVQSVPVSGWYEPFYGISGKERRAGAEMQQLKRFPTGPPLLGQWLSELRLKRPASARLPRKISS